ncbi:PAS domain-containing protein [Oceanibaculum nanhaiense]|uniref:PAS domain-containing protein n=1 Tax=Oceanibaculum nanhaiense TaxID=1909734 RepID=UPI003D27379E
MTGLPTDGQVIDPEPMLLAPALQPLLAYWKSRCDAERLPARADIDPLDIPRLLPFLYLVDVEHQTGGTMPYRFRYRLVGTGIVERNGGDPTGHYLDDFENRPFHETIVADYARCAAERRPVAASRRFMDSSGRHWPYQRLVLPLSENGLDVNMLLGGNAFADKPETNGRLGR